MERWKEYQAGKLQSGDIVQQDQIGEETLYWVVAESGIVGPISRFGKHDPGEVVKLALEPPTIGPAFTIEAEDGTII